MKSFPLKIVTPDGLSFDGNAESLLLRTDDGDVEFLAGHADYIASVGTGRARIITGGVSRFAACSGGFVSVVSGEVSLAAVTFEFSEDIDIKRAERAKDEAEKIIQAAKDSREMKLAEAKLKRALSRINAAEPL